MRSSLSDAGREDDAKRIVQETVDGFGGEYSCEQCRHFNADRFWRNGR